MKTAQVIEQVAGRIVDLSWIDELTFAEATEINAGIGWNFEGPSDTPGPNNYVLHTEVSLTELQLREAYALAQSWLNRPASPIAERRAEQLNRA